jgi:hypothetical protein
MIDPVLPSEGETRSVSQSQPGYDDSASRDASAGAEPSAPELAAAPFLPGGLGDLMFKAAHAYAEDYVMGSDEGPDHEPTEFERWLIEDFYNGLLSDDRFFEPIRRVLLQASCARELLAACQAMVRMYEGHSPPGDLTAITSARAAIAKALATPAEVQP